MMFISATIHIIENCIIESRDTLKANTPITAATTVSRLYPEQPEKVCTGREGTKGDRICARLRT